MPGVSAKVLTVLAGLVWHAGGLVLLLKSRSLLTEAAILQPGRHWPWLAVGAGVVIGVVKARYLFRKNLQNNLVRIAQLKHPQIWQFFTPQFFGALALMIGAGAASSRMAHQNYPLLVGVGAVDLTIAVALLGSSVVFWRNKHF
jgi:uncharacterized membrane protein